MGKISPVSTKYIVHASINSEGIVEKPDVIGAIFGQTEGLLGNELELRELQKSGRIGRIDVNLTRRKGRAEGEIIIPSSLNKAETALIAAAIETIERVGPCDAKILITSIEDVRVVKRKQVLKRAKELLGIMMKASLSESKEMSEDVFLSVRTSEVTEYGKDRLPAGPGVDDTNEIIVVEGRADVINLLRCGFRNVIALNGTSVPNTIIEVSKIKETTLFVDGDRGGDLIFSEMKQVAELDFLAVAPEGKEVEELTQKEIHKALRSKSSVEQVKAGRNNKASIKPQRKVRGEKRDFKPERKKTETRRTETRRTETSLSSEERKVFKSLLEDLTGTGGAFILDASLQVLGKVPISELKSSLRELEAPRAVVLDGDIDKDLVDVASSTTIKCLVGISAKTRGTRSVKIITSEEL